jgi:hypothetical protein
VPEDLWRRGRHSPRRRRITAVLACLLLAAGLVWPPAPGWATTEFASAGPDVLPAAVAGPYLWQQTFDAAPNGPVKLVFGTGHSLNLETALVLVGQDDSYRLIYLNPGDEAGTLSPDGRLLLRSNLLDLATGRVRTLSRPVSSFWPSVWAPDSRTALGVIEHDDGVISYGPNNEQLNDPQHADEIVLVDVASATVRTLHTADTSSWQAAFSPDGGRIAMNVGKSAQDQRLLILDVQTGAVLHSVPLTDRQQLAGPAAWTPDGSQVLLAHGDGCAWSAYCGANPDQPDIQRWHLQHVDATTGQITDDPARELRGWPSLVAWRDGDPVLQISAGYRLACETSALTASGLRALPLSVAGHGCGDYARDLLERGGLGGRALAPSPWQAQGWAYALLTVTTLLTVTGLVGVWIVRRRRGSRSLARAGRGSPPPRSEGPPSGIAR